jgi:hypothetical protein
MAATPLKALPPIESFARADTTARKSKNVRFGD